MNLPIWSLCALVLPQRLWPKAARLLARFSAQRLRPIEGLDERVASQFPAIADRLDANRIEHSFQYLRDWLPGGWDVKCDIEGLEHLAAAKKAGRGVVLWMGHFVFHGLASKKLLYHAGFPFHHLSRPEHGYSKTRLGICLLNPVRSKVEDRYLASRILIATGSEWRALRRAGSHLRSGGLVSVTAGAWEGRSTLEIPFLGGLYPLAQGAPALAQQCDADLVPVFLVRQRGSPASFRLIIGRPVPLPRRETAQEDRQEAMREFVRRHEAVVLRAPDEWRGWKYMKPSGASAEG